LWGLFSHGFTCFDPGKKVEYNGEVDFIFDFESIEEYARHFGLAVQPDYDNIQEWEILSPLLVCHKKQRANQHTPSLCVFTNDRSVNPNTP
jgi:hypothetical protein